MDPRDRFNVRVNLNSVFDVHWRRDSNGALVEFAEGELESTAAS